MTEERDSLVLQEVTKTYDTPGGTATILAGVTLTAAPGETLSVMGPSGSGKSTLLNIMGSLDRPTSGSVRLGGIDVAALSGKALAEFRARKAGFIFQDHHLLPQLTAVENVMLPTLAVGGAADAPRRARELLERGTLTFAEVQIPQSELNALFARFERGQ